MIETTAYTTETLDETRQEQAREYARLGRRTFIIELILGALYVLFWIFSGLSPWLRDQIYTLTQSLWLTVPLFALGFGLPYIALTAPLRSSKNVA